MFCETSAKTDTDVTMQAVASSVDVLNQFKYWLEHVNGCHDRTFASRSSMMEETDATNKLAPVAWLEESSERVIEAPVEFHVTAAHDAVKTDSRIKEKETYIRRRDRTREGFCPLQAFNLNYF